MTDVDTRGLPLSQDDWSWTTLLTYYDGGRFIEAALSFFPAHESRSDYEHLCQSLHRTKAGSYMISNLIIRCDPTLLVDTFALEQYNLKSFVEPSQGWVALDIGAYKGETALWLAQKLGSTGKVLAFEPNPSTRTILQSNLQGNASSDMAPIVAMPYGVSATSGMRLFVGTASAGSFIDDVGERDFSDEH